MGKSLDKQFGQFLRRKRGSQTYAAFARVLRVSPSTLFRLEQGQQSATLSKLEDIAAKLKCGVRDIFK